MLHWIPGGRAKKVSLPIVAKSFSRRETSPSFSTRFRQWHVVVVSWNETAITTRRLIIYTTRPREGTQHFPCARVHRLPVRPSHEAAREAGSVHTWLLWIHPDRISVIIEQQTRAYTSSCDDVITRRVGTCILITCEISRVLYRVCVNNPTIAMLCCVRGSWKIRPGLVWCSYERKKR